MNKLIINLIRLPLTILIRAPLMVVCLLLASIGDKASNVFEWVRDNVGGWE